MTETHPDIHASHLMAFVLDLLAPFLMTGSITDIQRARLAITETIAAYQAQRQNELVTVAQILGFALAALDNLRLSMAADLSLSMKLKLRGNANALNRSSQHNTETLEKTRQANPSPAPSLAEQAAMATWDEPTPETATEPVSLPPKPQPEPAIATNQPAARPSAEQQNRLHWANAMRTQAAKLRASTTNRPPFAQKTNTLWIDVLTDVANELALKQGAPGMSRTDLMRTTLMASSDNVPPNLFTRTQRPVATRKPVR